MTGPAVHFSPWPEDRPDDQFAVCGTDRATTIRSTDPAAVTCRRCINHSTPAMRAERDRRANEQLEQIRRGMRLLGGAP